MAGNASGGRKAAKTNMALHGKDFYKMIGSIGGKHGHTGGFAAHPELAKIWGRIGGTKSRRGSAEETARKREQAEKKRRKEEAWRYEEYIRIEDRK